MDDQFLHDLRREPSADFSRRLRMRLDASAAASRAARPSTLARWAGVAASIALVSLAFTLPPVRAGAQAFLDLFRIVNVTGFAFDAENLRALELVELDLQRMLGEQVEMLTETPAEPEQVASIEAAEARIGVEVLEPAYLPVGWSRDGIVVSAEHAARVTIDTSVIRELLDALAITDVSVPAGIDGQTATVRMPPVARLRYGNGERFATLVQSRAPEVTFPAGLDLGGLAEVALRIIGLDREDAYRFAQSIDWRSTLIVPVPASDASFRQVNIGGQEGLLIEPVTTPDGGRRDDDPLLLLWAAGDRVFALAAPLSAPALLEMAHTLQ